MLFTWLLFAVALGMEGIGSFISVVGLGSLFNHDLVILTMAVILDVAKVTSVSFLYKNWRELGAAMKGYFLVAVLVLMTITSSGAFGYLSSAFQKAVEPNKVLGLKLDSTSAEVTSLTAELQQLADQRSKLDQQVAQLPASHVRDRQRLLASFKPDYARIDARTKQDQDKLDALRSQQNTLQTNNVSQQTEIGPIAYVAQTFGVSMDQASKYIILVIISVFDPLAVMLILAGNFTLEKSRSKRPAIKTLPEKPAKKDSLAAKFQATKTFDGLSYVTPSPSMVWTYTREPIEVTSTPKANAGQPQPASPPVDPQPEQAAAKDQEEHVGALDPRENEPDHSMVEHYEESARHDSEDLLQAAIESGDFIVDPLILGPLKVSDTDPSLAMYSTSDISTKKALYE